MKKILGSLMVVGLLALGGCGSSAQDEFTSTLDEINDVNEYNALDFEFTLDELSMDTPTESSGTFDYSSLYTSMLSSLEGMGVSGSALIDTENDAADMDFTFTLLDNDIPLQMVMVGNDAYISGDALIQIMNLFSTISDTGVDLSGAGEELSGKYVQIDPEEFEGSAGFAQGADLTDIGDTGNLTYFSEYAKTLEDSTFEKEGDVITHTFTKEELAGLADFIEENGTEEQQDAVAGLTSENLEDFDDFQIVMSVDTSSKKVDMNARATSDTEDGNMAFGFTMSYTPQKSDEKVTVPSGDEVVSEAELETILAEGSSYTMSDEDFDTIMESMEGAQDYYTQDELIAMFEESGYTFTDEQKAQIASLYAAA